MKKKLFMLIAGVIIILPMTARAATGTVKIECDKTELAKNEETTCIISGTTSYSRISLEGNILFDDSFEVLEEKEIDIKDPSGMGVVPGVFNKKFGGVGNVTNGSFNAVSVTLRNISDSEKTTSISFTDIKMGKVSEAENLADTSYNITLKGDTGVQKSDKEALIIQGDGRTLTAEETEKVNEQVEKALLEGQSKDNKEEKKEETVENPKTGVDDNFYLCMIAVTLFVVINVITRKVKLFKNL